MKINSKAAPVSFRNVTKVYGKDVVAVDDINLEIEAGQTGHSAGSVGLRQDHNAPDDRRAGNGDQGRDFHRRPPM